MVELDSLDSSPSRDEFDVSDPKSSTPTDKPTSKNGHENVTPINPPPMRQTLSTRARPLFREEPLTYSTKKERQHTGFKPPPRPPAIAKSCPPKSRIFKNTDLYKPQALTFLDSPDGKKHIKGTPLNPKVYNTNLKKSYFQQAFTIEAKIGAGYFGTVFKVRSKENGQFYAIKIANEQYKGFGDRDRKLEEVRKHQFLPLHPNLVKFYESWEEDGRLYQQFELCNGNMGDYCEKNNEIAENLVWGYLVDLLQAVQHLHNHDLVHMDIKPDNIFFGFDGRCKLGDFGLIVDLIHQDKTGYREGDSKYLAPEILTGHVSKGCDIFSLGVTVLELACDLDLPSKGPLWSELREHGPQPSLTLKLSPELRRVLQLMMIKDPERRPGVNQILELPSVAKAVRRREREMLIRRCTEKMAMVINPLLLLITWVFGLAEAALSALWKRMSGKSGEGSKTPPVFGRPKPVTSDPVSPLLNNIQSPPYEVQDLFSDDDHDCSTISSAGSELAAPLQDSSTSSSNHNSGVNEEMLSWEKSPRRKAFTSPVRARTRTAARTPQFQTRTGLRSPQKRLNFLIPDDSPMSSTGGRRHPLEGAEQVAGGGGLGGLPLAAQQDDQMEDEELNIQPQCLATTFDCFSDEE
eukprot:TRINITY_DN1396_c0_g1_i13.p1 TRINITY_DN1396_c0_g1~~TRINITY_DN1396_c0_g1_i13.p1  ORF type:complete len:633 (-),score=127.92 TRINITY_DN1396_c0_g1_i13:209-2107(-)